MQDIFDFIKENRSFIWLFFESLAAITGLFLFNKYEKSYAKYFIYFLVYVVFIVIIGRYTYLVDDNKIFSFLDGTVIERNYWYYTIFWDIAATLFFGWYFMKIINNNTHRKILKTSVYIFIIVSISSILLNLDMFFNKTHSIIKICSALIILQCVVYYFLEILQSDKILTFYKSINFYICCAILILWLIQTPLTFFEQYYTKDDLSYVDLRGYINLIIIPIMYITYTIGLIISNPEYD